MNTRVRTTSHTMKSPIKQEKNENLMKHAIAVTNPLRLSKERKLALLQDVDKLKKKLRHEESVHKALERAFTRPLGALPRLPPYLPPATLELLAEVAVLEEEVVRLEELVVNFKRGLYEEAVYISSTKRNKENSGDISDNTCMRSKKEKSSFSAQADGNVATSTVGSTQLASGFISNQSGNGLNNHINTRQSLRRPNACSPIEEVQIKENQACITKNNQFSNSQRIGPRARRASMDSNSKEKLLDPSKLKLDCRMLDQDTANKNSLVSSDERASEGESNITNKTSEDLVKCLSSIFVRIGMHTHEHLEKIEFQDPYNIGKDFNKRNIGPYQHLCAIEANSINTSRAMNSLFLIRRLKLLLGKLALVDLQGLRHQQKHSWSMEFGKLALVDLQGLRHQQKHSWSMEYLKIHGHFYDAEGQVLLRLGIGSNDCYKYQPIPAIKTLISEEKHYLFPEIFSSTENRSYSQPLITVFKAMINVGGQSLNAMTIEHFILRLPYLSKYAYSKGFKNDEMKTQSIFGLEWSEPLVTFALSCGSWSSPSVRVYTASNVENELELAKKDYLQAAVAITKANTLAIPRLLDWYLLDFAKDMESFLDWVCLQLPSDLRNEAIRCLERGRTEPLSQCVQLMPYEFSFRYLLHQ